MTAASESIFAQRPQTALRLLAAAGLCVVLANCDCQGGETPPCTLVTEDGEAPTEEDFSTWNHCQTSSQAQADDCAGIAPFTDGSVLIGGQRGTQGFVTWHSASAVQMVTYLEPESSGETDTVGLGSVTNPTRVVSVMQGTWVAGDVTTYRIGMHDFGSATQNNPNPIDFGRIGDPYLTEDTSLERPDDILRIVAEAVWIGPDHFLVAGHIDFDRDIDAAATERFVSLYRRNALDQYVPHPLDDQAEVLRASSTAFLQEPTATSQTITALVDEGGRVLVGSALEIGGAPTGALHEVVFDAMDANPAAVREIRREPNTEIRDLFVTEGATYFVVDNPVTEADAPPVRGRLRHFSADDTELWSYSQPEEDAGGLSATTRTLDNTMVVVGNIAADETNSAQVFMAGVNIETGLADWTSRYKPSDAPEDFVTAVDVIYDEGSLQPGSFFVGGTTNFEHSRIRSYGGNVDGYVHRFNHEGKEWGYPGPVEFFCEETGRSANEPR